MAWRGLYKKPRRLFEGTAAESIRPVVLCRQNVTRTSLNNIAAEPVPSLPALGPWAPPAERGPSLESIYRVSLAVDLCEG